MNIYLAVFLLSAISCIYFSVWKWCVKLVKHKILVPHQLSADIRYLSVSDYFENLIVHAQFHYFYS